MELTLNWNDIKSSTLTPDAYIEKFSKKPDIISKIENYNPREDALSKIKQIFKSGKKSLKILAIGAEWCPDCSIHVPEMVKIVKKMQLNEIELKILYGVKVDPFHKKGESLWSARHSPPEATNPKFNLAKIPTFYLFNNEGTLFGTIVEHPKNKPTLEEEILYFLSK